MELSIDQLNVRFGGQAEQGDFNVMFQDALDTGGPVSAVVARSMACCLALATSGHWRRFEIVGSLRREQAYVGDLDLLVQGDLSAMSKIYQNMGFSQGIGVGGGRSTIYAGKFQIDFWTALDEDWGAAMLSLSGPTPYVIGLAQVAARQGMELNRHGLFRGPQRIAGRTEEEIYHALGKEWKPPHMRGL